MPLTDEEIDAQLEKIQQNITRTLQSIDQNFERCNQTITGSIIPEVEKFTKASREIWEHSKTWLYFFQMQAYGATADTQEQENITNRPPLTPYTPTNTTTMDHTHPTSTLSGVWERLHRDLHKQRGYAFEQSSPGTDSMKGIFRPSRIVDRRNINVARSLHQQIYNSGDFSSTQSSSMYAPTVRLLGIDDDIDSINNSSNNEHSDNNIDIDDLDHDDQHSTTTKTSTIKRGTPIHAFTAITTPTTNTNKRRMDKGKSVDTNNNKKPRYGENPMLQPPGSTNRSTLMHRLEEAKHQPLSTTDVDMNDTYLQHGLQQHIKSTPGPSTYNNNHSTTTHTPTSEPLASTPTMERVLNNYNKDYRNLPKRNLLLEETNDNANTTPINPFPSPSSHADPSRRKTAEGAPSSSFFAAPTERKQLIQQDTKKTDQLHDPRHNNNNTNNIYESSQGTSLWAPRTGQGDGFEFSRPQSRQDGPATTAAAAAAATETPPPPPLRQSPDRRAPSPFHDDYDANDNMDMAYEFSPIMTRQAQDDNAGRLTPHSQRDTASSQASGYTMTGSTSSMITMMSGVSGQIPAKFALHYFPETFRDPPASVRLTKIYNLFADRPGQMLRWRQVVDLMRADPQNDDDAMFQQDALRILLDMLTRKRFLRRIDKGWTLRS